jgi:outer membrane receptor protein involved in Fe transport
VRRVAFLIRLLGLSLSIAFARAEPIAFSVPAQPVDDALLALSRQAKIEVLFSSGELHQKVSAAVIGRFEPADALARMLQGTGFTAHATSPGKYAVTRRSEPTTSIRGRLLAPDGSVARGIRVALPALRLSRMTDAQGEFLFPEVPAGDYRLLITASGVQTMQLTGLHATTDVPLLVPTQTLQLASEPAQLAPFVVEGTTDQAGHFGGGPATFPPRTAVGNLDLARSEQDAIPFTIYDREHIRRSGVVNLNEYLQRELLDSDASGRPPEQDAGNSTPSFATGSSNLSMRGFNDAEETIIMVNGRRLPEVLTSGIDGRPQMPDVNFIPLSLVQQVEVLPLSASSLYNGNPVGGVINIVLRPGVDANSTEITATYNNAVHGFDAPQSSLSLLNSESLLGGALRLRLNASTTRSMPATEAELGYHRRNSVVPSSLAASIYRATPNIHSADLSPLFGAGTSPVTSVAPGADGSGGIAAFANRQGLRNLDLFKSPGGMAASIDSSDDPYGREQTRNVYFGSVVYDVTPWLQLGLDGTLARTVVHRGYDVLHNDFFLAGDSPRNPFHQDVVISLNDTARELGQNYNEARLEFSSLVAGALVKLPREWRLSIDAQYAHNITQYRGLYGADPARWQALVDTGVYNPLRDTQVFGPPAAFYDQVLIYRGARNRFVTVGDYETLDAAFRATNESLRLPTGRATINLGGDYRRSHLAAFDEQYRYADGSLYSDENWGDRTLQRYSVFGELRAPLLPDRFLPGAVRAFEADLALRYIGANSAKESYFAPTLGLKCELTSGFAVRGSVTTSSRYPTPQLNRLEAGPPTGGVILPYTESIDDPVLHQRYDVPVNEVINPNLLPESAVTQSIGVFFQRGKVHRVRATLDFVDVRKTNEDFFLSAQTLVLNEALFPGRVLRGPDGVITQILTGRTNLAWRHSQNFNASADYAWTECLGGTLELYGRLLYYELYRRQLLPDSRPVDELAHPDGSIDQLRYRANFGVGWSNRDFGCGLDGRYFSPRVLPVDQWAAQGHDRIRPSWQFDTYVESDLGRWLPWDHSRHGLRAQLRVNNVFGDRFPKYVDEPSGAGVQPYGDWRGRTYSLSLTANF